MSDFTLFGFCVPVFVFGFLIAIFVEKREKSKKEIKTV
jgi:hypothetical protein